MENLVALTCPNCGAPIKFNVNMGISPCEFCKSYIVSDSNNLQVPSEINLRMLKPDIQFMANFVENSFNSQGGHLWITAKDIFFKPHAFNFGNLDKKYMRIADIVSMVKTNEKFGLSKNLTITDKNGNSMKLVSWNRDEIISAIESRKL